MKVDDIKDAEEKHRKEVDEIQPKNGDEAMDGEGSKDGDDEDIPGKDLANDDDGEVQSGDDGKAMDEDAEQLEEAPGKRVDIRVPEIPRAAATKRGAVAEAEGDRPSKYMAQIEEDLRNRDARRSNGDVMGFTIGAMDVAKVYSPERVVKVARNMGLDAGFSLDITNVDERGVPWDFTKVERRNAAIRKIFKEEPLFVIGSPLCTEWSIMQNANKHRWTTEERTRRLEEARIHLEFMCKI